MAQSCWCKFPVVNKRSISRAWPESFKTFKFYLFIFRERGRGVREEGGRKRGIDRERGEGEREREGYRGGEGKRDGGKREREKGREGGRETLICCSTY